MPRVACLWVPAMMLAAHVRLEPELADVPFVLVEGRDARRTVGAVSKRAAKTGVIVGMSISQAYAICDGLIVRPTSREALDAATTALVEVATSVSPRAECQPPDRVFVDCQGSTVMWPAESALASTLAARALRCGLPAWVGVADSKLAAAIAARHGRGVHVVPAGDDRAFLAPRAVSLLDPDAMTAATLASWGIHSIGDLVALPAGAVAHRLGAAGLALVRRARAEDDAPLVARTFSHAFEERFALDYAVDRLEPLVFVLRRLLDCLVNRLELHGFGCRAIELALGHEKGEDRRTVPVAAPTTDAKTLLLLLRAHLEAHLPSRGVTSLAVVAQVARIAPTQLDLLRPAGPAPAALAAVVARLAALCGSDHVGVLHAADTHRPDAVRLEQFTGTVRESSSSASSWSQSTADAHDAGPPAVVRLALRAFRPPVSLEVFENRTFLEYVRGRGFGGRVVQWAGPWRVRGEWWTHEPYAREYYDVELSDGGVYRIYRDARSARWLADGVYD